MTFADLLYKAWAHVWNNKQTWTGSAMALVSFIQVNDKLKGLMSVDAYEWTMLVLGAIMVLFARSTSGGVVSKIMPASIPKELPPKEGK